MRAEKFMAEITVTVFDVHKIETQFPCGFRRAMKILDDLANFSVRENGIVIRQSQSSIQDRMAIKNARLGPVVCIRPAKSSRMRQLQSDKEAFLGSRHLAMFFKDSLPQCAAGRMRLRRHHKVVRIGAAFVRNANRLPSPDEFRTALSEPFPPTNCVLAGISIGGPIPPLHRLNANAIADFDSSALERKQ